MSEEVEEFIDSKVCVSCSKSEIELIIHGRLSLLVFFLI